MAPQNHIKELPLSWRIKVNLTNLPDFYIKFVDNDTNESEANARAIVEGIVNNVEARLHIFHLQGKVKVIHYASSYDETSKSLDYFNQPYVKASNLQPLIPESDNEPFFSIHTRT